MLFDLIRNGFSLQLVVNLFVRVFTVFCILPIHEYAHALTANRLGDDTARLKGRLTLNPIAHLNIYGTIMILLCGFGYAQPVPVNPRNFKNPKAGMAITAAAGPLSNLILCAVFMLFANLAHLWYLSSHATIATVTVLFCEYAALINVSLAIFNLIPIPPLDGSRLLTVFLPTELYFKIMRYERYIVIGLFILMITGIFSRPFSFVCNAVMKLISRLIGLPFGSNALVF